MWSYGSLILLRNQTVTLAKVGIMQDADAVSFQQFFKNWSQSSKNSGVKDKKYLSKSQVRIKVSKVPASLSETAEI